MPEQKPWEMNWSQPSQAQPNDANVNKKPWEMDWGQQEPQKEQSKGVIGHAQDAGVSLLKGVVSVPETLVGLADIPTGGRVGKFLEENTPIQFKQTKDIVNDWHTDQYKEQQRQFNEAGSDKDSLVDKVIDKGKVALSNPSMILNTVVESAPSMLAGGAAARGIGMAAKGVSPVVAGAVGEGAVMAGQQAEQIRNETNDKLLTPEQSALSVATGALGSLFGLAGGQVAKKMGFDDFETAMASGKLNSQLVGESIQQIPLKSIPKSIIGGALSEGLLEELPQSVSEQLLQNIALDKPLDDGLDSAIVMGTLAGMAMGGGMNTVSAPVNYLQNKNAYDEPQAANIQGEQPQSNTDNLDKTESQPTSFNNATNPQNETSNIVTPQVVEQPSQTISEQDEYDIQQYALDGISSHIERHDLAEARRRIEDAQEKGWDVTDKVTQFNDLIQSEYQPIQQMEQLEQPIQATQEASPSEQMGINPDDGPLSSAAALAVDSGALQTGQSIIGQPDAEWEQSGKQQAVSESIASHIERHDLAEARRRIDNAQAEGLDVTDVVTQFNDLIQSEYQPIEKNTATTPEYQAFDDIGAEFGEVNRTLVDWTKADAKQRVQWAKDAGLNPFQQKHVVNTTWPKLSEQLKEKITAVMPSSISEQSVQIESAETPAPVVDTQSIQPSFNQRIQEAHLNNPSIKPKLIQEEIALGRPRAEVLAEVSQAINEIGSVQASNKAEVDEQQKNLSVNPQAIPTSTSQNIAGVESASGVEVQGVSESNGQNSSILPIAEKITQLEQQLVSTPVMQKQNLRKQIDQLKSEQNSIAATLWQSMLPEQRQTLAKQINTALAIKNRLPTAEWENIGPAVKNKLILAIGQQNAGDNLTDQAAHENDILIKKPASELKGQTNEQNDRVEQLPFGNRHTQQGTGRGIKSVSQRNHGTIQGGELGIVENQDSQGVSGSAADNTGGNADNSPRAGRSQDNQRANADLGKNPQSEISGARIESKNKSLEKLTDKVNRLADIADDLITIESNMGTAEEYAKELLGSIAKYNPDVLVHIVSDFDNNSDPIIQSIADQLQEGGFYAIDSGVSYIYPKSSEWKGTLPELINHELIHAATQKHIDANKLTPEQLESLEELKEALWNNNRESVDDMDSDVLDRINYAMLTSYPHEMFTVFGAESGSREILNQLGMLDKFDTLFDNVLKEAANDNGQIKQRSSGRADQEGASEGIPGHASGVPTTVSAVRAATGSSKNIERSTGDQQTGVSATEENKTTVEPQNKSNEKKRFSRAENPAASSTVAQVREALVSRFGEKTIADLETQGILNIVQDQQESMTGSVEGWYENGKVTLVASNLDADSAVATFLHELGGHGGFQNLMNKDVYADLMRQFERMVEQGNPVAVEAKRLAERELKREVQLDEYLPYMITLASQMQTKNILQKGAIKRFMDRAVSAVKAWLYDKGIKLNLNEKDVLALAERMVAVQSKTSSVRSQNDDMRFSRQFNAQQTLDNIMNGIKGLNVQSTKNWAGNKWIDWLGLALSGLGRRQLTEIYSKILPSLSKYNELAAQMDADKNDAGAEADTIVREWSNLKDDSQLADLMHDATLAKIDPAKPHVAGDSIIKYNQLRDDFNALSPEAQDIYLKARDAYKKHYAKVHQAIKERILRSELSNTKKAELLKDMDNQFFGYVKGVYFPLARFGKYVVIVRNQNGQVESVSRAETMAEAQKSRTEMMKKFPLWKVDRVILDKEFNASRDGVGRGFMSSLFSEVDNLGLSTAEQAEFEDTLSQLYLSSMPDLSWAKHGIHRKGTAGFSQDARRAFAQNMFHGAGYLAKLRYADQMAEQLDEMQKYATEQAKINPEYDQPKAQRVIDEMNKRHENLMNPKSHPLSSMLTSVGFIYYLGLSPAAAMVNLSQTPLVAYPIMGAKWGFDNAAKELLKASNDFRKGVEFHKVKWEGTKTDLYKAVSADISKFLNKDEQQAYKDAVDRGVIDVTQAHDLAGIAQGEDSGVMWKIRPIMRAASTMFHTAERFNREVTFIAAYRLSRQTGATHDAAFDQAVDATYKGHFDYSSGNRPRIMQGNVAKVLLLFKQFGQNMIYTLSRQTYQSIKGETETERKEARRALGAVLGMHAAFAGVLGLPLVGFLLGAASWIGGDDDDPWDAEIALRNYLAETFNPTISNLIMKGVPRAVTPIDMSGRVGINNLLLPDVQEGLEGKRWAESAMSAALGPVAGIGTNMVKGAQEISEGHNLRGVETMLPVFLKNFAKTYRYSDEGVQDKTGISILDDVSSMDLLVQGMGFSPSDVRTANEGKSAIYQLNRKLNERRSSLMTLWSRAKMMEDQEEMDNVWKEIQGFNEKNPTRRITRMNLNQSYRNRKRRVDRAEDGVYLSRNQQGAREAGAFAFGE